jgi:hypothetical protein
MPHKLEVWIRQKMVDIFLLPGAKIVNTNNLVLLDQEITKMGTKKTCATGDDDIFFIENWLSCSHTIFLCWEAIITAPPVPLKFY